VPGIAMRRVIISVHGINTRGVWQKDLAPLLALQGFIPYALDYGKLVLGFASGRLRGRKVEWLQEEYLRVTAEAKCRRPSIIAHSLGTYLVAKVLEKYDVVRFDKVILCGSIVRPDFDWSSRLTDGQVNLVRNDYGKLDIWPLLAELIVPDAGPSGASGFTGKGATHDNFVQQAFPQYKHSDYFHRLHFTDHWIPTLRRVVLNEVDAKELTDKLGILVRTAARRLGVSSDSLRANIFMEQAEGVLTIPKGLHYQMGRAEELTVAIRIGEGCTGKAFEERKPAIAVLQRDWGKHDIPDSELRKVDPRLRWIVSIPIPNQDVPGSVLGIMNLDGLDQARAPEEIATLVDDGLMTAQILAVILNGLK
jgi:pimeloyl-ACP methyl ester carboxylesterase